MEEEEGKNKQNKSDKVKKASKSSVGIVRKVKFLFATPIGHVILWIILFIVIIMLFIGLYTFITSMPGVIRDRVVSWVRSWLTRGIEDPAESKITQEELISIGQYLEENGYDLEKHGFAEKVTRKNQEDVTGQDLNEIKSTAEQTEGGTITYAEKGEIENVESTNLRAYIAAENRSYMIQNQNLNLEYSSDRLTQILMRTGKIDNGYDEIYEVVKNNLLIYGRTNKYRIHKFSYK